MVPDDPSGVLPALEEQLAHADLLITTGGVSMGGEHDVVKAALRELGTVTFRKVAMQPGMPQGFGMIGEDAGADLHAARQPGQRLRVVPDVRQARARGPAGRGDLSLPSVRATLTGPVRSPSGRRSYLRGVLDGSKVTPLSGQGSHQIAYLGRANALIIVPSGSPAPADDEVDVLVLPCALRPRSAQVIQTVPLPLHRHESAVARDGTGPRSSRSCL